MLKNKIYELIERIEQAMLGQKCRRYDIQGKQVLVSLEKTIARIWGCVRPCTSTAGQITENCWKP